MFECLSKLIHQPFENLFFFFIPKEILHGHLSKSSLNPIHVYASILFKFSKRTKVEQRFCFFKKPAKTYARPSRPRRLRQLLVKTAFKGTKILALEGIACSRYTSIFLNSECRKRYHGMLWDGALLGIYWCLITHLYVTCKDCFETWKVLTMVNLSSNSSLPDSVPDTDHDTSPYAILFIFTSCTIGGKFQVHLFCGVTLSLSCFDIKLSQSLSLISLFITFMAFLFPAIVRQLMKGWPIPYTVVLIVLGLCVGAISGAVPELQK